MGSQPHSLVAFRSSRRRYAVLLTLITGGLTILSATGLHADKDTQTSIHYQHGYAFLTDPAKPAGFSHFPYVNPAAPKGGEMRIPEMGTWDNFNPVSLKGRTVRGVWFWVGNYNLIHDRLMESALDEPASYYGRLAEGIAVAEDGAWVAFKLRKGARWHDGTPITVDDVVFTFETMKDKRAAPSITTPMQMFERIEVLNSREFRFWVQPEARGNA
ncbi:MAG: ABC transporter substrate-binding protein, partial [Proteobacteria bacterium]|nr:ABC transporter substrate-binding protein [Pseudomonadota bacterium]